MKYSYNWLNELSGLEMNPQDMAELLTMHSFQIDSVEPGDNDAILTIDVLPNRTHDALSHQGVARELALLHAFKSSQKGAALGMPDVGARIQAMQSIDPNTLTVDIRDEHFGSRYLGVVIEGLGVKPSPRNIQEKLAALGIKVINNLVDITNYVMLETGMPLHAFDLDQIEGGTMVMRGAKKNEQIITLDGITRMLPEETLVIEDAHGLIDLVGAMGGERSSIANTTTRIFLQAAIFDPERIQRSTREMGFRTEASVRYAAAISPMLAEIGLMRAVELLEAEGGRVAGKIDIYPKTIAAPAISLDSHYCRRLLGTDVSDDEIARILDLLGCAIARKDDRFLITPSALRLDLQTPEDLIEEIGRIIGYETIQPVMPVAAIVLASSVEEIVFADHIRDALVAAGMAESYNYSLIPDPSVSGTLTLENPMSDKRNYLRPSLLPGLIKNAQDTMRFFDEVRMFEIGRIFRKNSALGIEHSAFAINGVDERSSAGGVLARKGNASGLFYELKGIVSGLFESLRIGEVRFEDYKTIPEPATIPGLWDASRTAEIKVGDTEIGFVGAIQQAEKLSIVACELDLEALLQTARKEREFQPIPKYPAVTRDISILVNLDIRIAQVENTIENSGAKYIQDVDLFDIFEPKEIGEEAPPRKSIAFHIIYQADDRTLTDEEVNNEHAKVEIALREILDAEIR